MFVRTSIVGAGSVAVLAAAGLVPAQAADNDLIGETASVMLQEADIPASLGTPRAHIFTAEHKTGMAAPWICEKGDRSLTGKKAPRAYTSSFWLAKKTELELSQTAFVYSSRTATDAAWKDLVKKAKKCKGTTKAGNWQTPGGTKYVQKLSNGKTDERYDGATGWWVYSDFEASSAREQWAEDEFVVFFRSGTSIQLIDYDRAPTDSMPTSKRETVEALGEVLDQRWLTRP